MLRVELYAERGLSSCFKCPNVAYQSFIPIFHARYFSNAL